MTVQSESGIETICCNDVDCLLWSAVIKGRLYSMIMVDSGQVLLPWRHTDIFISNKNPQRKLFKDHSLKKIGVTKIVMALKKQPTTYSRNSLEKEKSCCQKLVTKRFHQKCFLRKVDRQRGEEDIGFRDEGNCWSASNWLHTVGLLAPSFMFPSPRLLTFTHKSEEMYIVTDISLLM